MKVVLITGAAGFIGMHASIRFLNEGWFVIGLDNFNNYYPQSIKEDRIKEISAVTGRLYVNFELLRYDLNSGIWDELLERKIDAVVHLAAQAGVRFSLENPMAYLESNVIGFQKVLDFVKLKGIEQFVYASSSSVYGKSSNSPFKETEPCNAPESYYAATKKTNEMMAFSYNVTTGMSSIGLRFFTVYGPWGRPDMAPLLFTDAALNSKQIQVYNYGEQYRDFTFIDDIIEGVYRCVLLCSSISTAEIFNIGNGKPVHLLRFIEEIEKHAGKTIKKLMVPAQKGDVEETFADTTKLHDYTGYKSKISIDEGLRRTIDWFKCYYKL